LAVARGDCKNVAIAKFSFGKKIAKPVEKIYFQSKFC
jgi:hypothetical protein